MDEILKLIAEYPRHFSQKIKSNPELSKWVHDHSKLRGGNFSFAAHIYSAITGQSAQCTAGMTKRFANMQSGFRFCGPAGKCQCCAQSVSQQVTHSKASLTAEQQLQINSKRAATTLAKYGVSNVAQTAQARQNHSAFYSDLQKVEKTVEKVKNTKIQKYGSAAYNNRTKAVATCQQKYGVDNPWLLKDSTQNPLLAQLRDPELLGDLYPAHSVEQIAQQLGVHEQTVYRYLNLHGFREPYKSTFEKEITHYIEQLGVANIVTNTRTLISREIDIYLPDHSLAIEYNGLFWHHDQVPHITKTYHYEKFRECENLGITLFTIFGDSWHDRADIWKKKIANRLGKTTDQVWARKTKIVELSAADSRSILEHNHVQGYCAAQYCYGLDHEGKLVAAMTFSSSRAGIGRSARPNTYELVRYVTACSVPGGASRLLNHFVKTHTPSEIFSYSDNRYSTGQLYQQLGFELENENPCGYWYHDPVKKKSYHRYNFTKHKLTAAGHDPALTEREIMNQMGFLRIYDCGTRTWRRRFV